MGEIEAGLIAFSSGVSLCGARPEDGLLFIGEEIGVTMEVEGTSVSQRHVLRILLAATELRLVELYSTRAMSKPSLLRDEAQAAL